MMHKPYWMYNVGDEVIERVGSLEGNQKVKIEKADSKFVYTPRGFKYSRDTGKGYNDIGKYNVIVKSEYVGKGL